MITILIIGYIILYIITYKVNKYIITKAFPTLEWTMGDRISCSIISLVLIAGTLVNIVLYYIYKTQD